VPPVAGAPNLRARPARDVVRSLARAVERPCSRPACGLPAQATLTFRYGTREAWIERLADAPPPQSYDLCQAHAARTSPPHGWQLRDRRPDEERQVAPVPATPDDLGGDRTVAVLAAALRAVPDAVSEDAVPDRAPEVARLAQPSRSDVEAGRDEPAPLDPPVVRDEPAPLDPPVVRDVPAPSGPPVVRDEPTLLDPPVVRDAPTSDPAPRPVLAVREPRPAVASDW
jgi:hypothetical protein